MIKKKINLEKGSAKPNTDKVGKISWKDVEEIAKIKLPDLNAIDIEQAKKIIAGSAAVWALKLFRKVRAIWQ